MRRGVVVGMGCALLLAGAVLAHARDERELSRSELRAEIHRNKAMAAYVKRNGEPDYAESRFLADEPPWDDREVTLYYLAARKEIGFARAYILGKPEIDIQRYVRPLTEEQVAALTSRARASAQQAPATATAATPPPATTEPAAAAAPTPPADGEQTASLSPAERAELAAQRAEDAAGRVEAAADSAERAADRAEAIAEKAAHSVHRAAHK